MKRLGVVVLALVSAITSSPAAAAPPGFDASFFGESAFLTLRPGDTGTLSVFFTNTGSSSWVGGTSSEVVLSVCVDTPAPQNFICDVLSPYADFALNWTSQRIYAKPSQATVTPGATATFIYTIKVPAGARARDYYFRGELVHSATLTEIHPVGYYHVVKVVP